MLLHFCLGGLTAFTLGLAAFFALTTVKARRHRMAVDLRLENLGRETSAQADALNRRCDDLRSAIDRLETLADRVRLLELEREVARMAAGGRVSDAAAERLDEAVADLRADVAAKEA